MIYRVMCVRDRAADVFAQPMFLSHVNSGIRTFTMEINRKDEKNMLWLHPEDFDLYELGSFDDNLAKFELFNVPRQCCVGKDVRQPD